MSEFSVVGKSVTRLGVRELVTGEAKYSIDAKLPGMLHGKILRSPHPHARILSVDTSKAEKVPGVKAVVTSRDVSGVPQTVYSPQIPPLADGIVRYVGEPVAAVAAVDEYTATEALDLIKVEYEELPAVFAPEEAMKPGAPKIHNAENNIGIRCGLTRGDSEKGFAEADFIAEGRFITPPQNHVCMEPANCMASFDASGRLTIHSQQTSIFWARSDVARVMNMQENQVRVIQSPTAGGHFGSGNSTPRRHFIASFLAKKTLRPVKIVNTREEEFISVYPMMPVVLEMKIGVKKDGTLIAKQTKVIGDSGAYFSVIALSMLSVAMMRHESLYRFNNVKTEAFLVFTNRVPTCSMRGFGNQTGHFALESLMDQLAEGIDMDPAEIRLKNAIKTGDTSIHGWVIRSGGLTECIQKSVKSADWKRKRTAGKSEGTKKRGIGMGSAIHVAGMKIADQSWGCGALVKINDDGTANLLLGEGDCGQGARTVLAQICAEELGIPYEHVWASLADTDFAPYCAGPLSSRTTATAGNAVKLAASDARRQLVEAAAKKLGVPADSLEIKDQKIYARNNPGLSVSYAEAAMSPDYRPIMGRGTFIPPQPGMDLKTWYGDCATACSFTNQIAEVEVDTETGVVKLLKYTGAYDLGRAINPIAAEGQAEGGVSFAMGYAMTENLEPVKGHVVGTQFTDYKVPTMLDMPEIKPILVETDDPACPFGAKGLGEIVGVPTAPAIANAIYNAVGVRIKELPITPEKVLRALQEKAKS